MSSAVNLRTASLTHRRIVTVTVVLAALVAGCGAPPSVSDPALSAFVSANGLGGLEQGRLRVSDGQGRTRMTVAVVVADTAAARTRGLQGVAHVPEGVGMLFTFPDRPSDEPRPAFWMLDTVVALDIAFVADGTVVGVATMQPCTVRPCPTTHPGVAYDSAIEVAAGALATAGIAPGDRVETLPAGYG